MKTQSFGQAGFNYLIFIPLKNFFYWPLWWYSSGVWLILKLTGHKIVGAWQGLALGVWLKNIFRPMYGQSDAASRIISFFMRLIQIILRLLLMLILLILLLLLPIIYLGLPVLTVWRLWQGI